MNEFSKILEKSEKVLWEGKPKFWPFFIGSIPITIFGLIMLFFLIPFIFIMAKTGLLVFLLPHITIVLLFILIVPLYQYLSYRNTHYAITNKRILIQKGIIGRDFDIVDFDQITNAAVDVGIIDKIFGNGSGSILVSTAGNFVYTKRGAINRPYTLQHTEDPYNTFKFFKKVSHDVKTDIHYPNKYRPKTNPGYKTNYGTKKRK